MTPGQRLIWKLRLEDAAIFITSFAISVAGLSLARWLTDWNVRTLSLFLFAVFPACTMFLCWLIFPTRRDHQEREKSDISDAEFVPFDEFVNRSDAIVAPNHQHLEGAIRDWLRRFIERRGADSVFIAPSTDEPHLCNKVFLLSSSLTNEDKRELIRLGADGIKTLSVRTRQRLFPQAEPSDRAFEVVWD
jgi:hypothetical protein